MFDRIITQKIINFATGYDYVKRSTFGNLYLKL